MTRVHALVVTLGIALAPVETASVAGETRAGVTFASTLCVGQGAAARAYVASRANAAREPTADLLAAAALALSPRERASLEAALQGSVDRWAIRANPLLDGLVDDEDPDAPLRAWMRDAPRVVALAAAASERAVCTPDEFCVEATTGSCASGFAPARDAALPRARFVLWGRGNALRIHATSREEARSTADRLRARFAQASVDALVVDPSLASALRRPELRRVAELWEARAVLRELASPTARPPPASQAHRGDGDDATTDVVVYPSLAFAVSDAARESLVATLASR